MRLIQVSYKADLCQGMPKLQVAEIFFPLPVEMISEMLMNSDINPFSAELCILDPTATYGYNYQS